MSLQDCNPAFQAGRGRGRGRARGQGQGLRRLQEGQILDTADLHLAMLVILGEKPRTGLGTMQALAARGCAGVASSAAEIYSGLMLLEETGRLASGRDVGGRLVYSLTDTGAAALAAKRLLADAILADAAYAARNAARFSGSPQRPRCCRRTAAAIVASITRQAGAAPAARPAF